MERTDFSGGYYLQASGQSEANETGQYKQLQQGSPYVLVIRISIKVRIGAMIRIGIRYNRAHPPIIYRIELTVQVLGIF